MKYLLDTHVFLWWNLGDPRLSHNATAIISDGNNEIFLSAVSAWEIAIKIAKKRLTVPDEPVRFVPSRMQLHGFQPLPIQIHHATRIYELPIYHTDPFDRLLIAQSQIESMPLISVDADIRKYKVEVIW
ncbi:MAG TPA: type II toxin-antitoxin system VapC family toxin [Anaerolineales bacterium]